MDRERWYDMRRDEQIAELMHCTTDDWERFNDFVNDQEGLGSYKPAQIALLEVDLYLERVAEAVGVFERPDEPDADLAYDTLRDQEMMRGSDREAAK